MSNWLPGHSGTLATVHQLLLYHGPFSMAWKGLREEKSGSNEKGSEYSRRLPPSATSTPLNPDDATPEPTRPAIARTCFIHSLPCQTPERHRAHLSGPTQVARFSVMDLEDTLEIIKLSCLVLEMRELRYRKLKGGCPKVGDGGVAHVHTRTHTRMCIHAHMHTQTCACTHTHADTHSRCAYTHGTLV